MANRCRPTTAIRVRLVVLHPETFGKSVKWGAWHSVMEEETSGFWEENGYNMYGDPFSEKSIQRLKLFARRHATVILASKFRLCSEAPSTI